MSSYRQNYPPRQTQPPPRRKRRRGLLVFLLLVVIALIASVAMVGYTMYEEVDKVERAGTFYPGVYVDNVPLYGATPQEAYDYLVSQAKSGIEGWRVSLAYGEHQWEITPELLGMNSSIESIVQEEINKAFYVGRVGDSFLDRYQVISDLKENPYYGFTTGVTQNTSWIDTIVAEIEATVYVAPTDATWAFDATRKNPIVITEEVYGQRLDTAALKEQVVQMVKTMTPGHIQVQTEPVAPALLASDLQSKVVLLASYESPISTRSTENRILNIELGCRAFNGKMVQAGEKVSFNSWTGKRTKQNGYYEAQEIANGEYRTGYGGGICQVSTALYNAVVRANLQVNTRRNHGLQVNYVEMGADATVYDDRIDFVFTNNTGEPIYILARVESAGKGKQCVFQIYGRPDPNGYTYSLKHVTLEEIPIPEADVEKDRTGEFVTYTDEMYEASKGSMGYKVETYLVVKDANGAVVQEKSLYVDTYKPQAPKVYVGVQVR